MTRRMIKLLPLACALLLASCASRQGGLDSPSARPELPAPADVSRQAADFFLNRSQPGSGYLAGINSGANLTIDADNVQMSPDYSGAGTSGLAFAGYILNVNDYSGSDVLELLWDGSAPAPADCFIGLANFASNRWDWLQPAPDFTLTVDDRAAHSNSAGSLIAVVLLGGNSAASLHEIRLGGPNPPHAILSSTAYFGPPGQSLSLIGGLSFDEDGSIAGYEFDPEGDGTFEPVTQTGFVDHQYNDPGTYAAALRVTDDEGLSSTSFVNIVISSGAYDEIENNDDIASAQPLPSGDFSGFTGSSGPAGSMDGDSDDFYLLHLAQPTLISMTLSYLASDADLDLEIGRLDEGEVGSWTRFSTADDDENAILSLPAADYIVHVLNYSVLTEMQDKTADYNLAASFISTKLPFAKLKVTPDNAAAPTEVDLDASGSLDFGRTITQYEWDLYGDGIFESSDVIAASSFSASRVGHFRPAVRITNGDGFTAIGQADLTLTGTLDEVEPDDDAGSALVLPGLPIAGFSGDSGGNADGADPVDVLRFNVPAGGVDANFVLHYDALIGKLRIAICELSGETLVELGHSDGGTGTENAVVALADAGDYYVVITPHDGASGWTLDGELN